MFSALFLCACAAPASAPEVDAAVLDAASDARPAPLVCVSAPDCDALTWCSASGCGDTEGRCEARPASCPGEWRPTCGCDGHTYASPCQAQLVGATIAAWDIPCLSTACGHCAAGSTCVDCATAGPQCVAPGARCAR